MTSNFWASTQCNDWLLSRSQISIARAEDLEYATSADEVFSIRIWLINCISSLTKRLALRQRITATAIVFFNRFYACSPGNSFSSTDPTLVATACVYVAAKVEESPVHIRNVVQEAIKLWAEIGHWKFPNDVVSLAEMEFYLMEDLQFHLVVYHPYRSLITIAGAVGKGTPLSSSSGKSAIAISWSKMLAIPSFLPAHAKGGQGQQQQQQQQQRASPVTNVASGPEALVGIFDSDMAFGQPGDGLTGRSEDVYQATTRGPSDRDRSKEQEQRLALEEMIEERHQMLLFSGDDEMPMAHLEELDEQVLQMAWFILNDTYRTDLLLLFPPHLIAVAAIFLALVLHDPSREKMLKSKRWMQDRRDKFEKAIYHSRGDNAATTAHEGELNSGKGPSVGASPPKQQYFPQISTPKPQNLRGLASLPPRPSHLPPRPGGPPQATQAQTSNPATPVGTPKVSDTATFGSPLPDASGTPKSGAALPDEKAKSKSTYTAKVPVPPPDAMTFLAALNVDLNIVGEIVQELISVYQFWSQEGREDDGQEGVTTDAIDFNDGPTMFKRLERMRELRRIDLLQNGPGW
ncbi:hypothetical protein CBS101457_003839 [Exobasidium rhododendri]|nr:hypothetical protein CBS101457_003839 [Exobasidium rhododendri]